MAKAKLVKGSKFAAVEENYDKKMSTKDLKSMKTAGIANELKLAKKEQGKTKKPGVKPQKKVSKIKN